MLSHPLAVLLKPHGWFDCWLPRVLSPLLFASARPVVCSDRRSTLSLAGRWLGSSTLSVFPRLFAISANLHWLAPTVFAPPRSFVRSALMPFAAVVAVFGYPHTVLTAYLAPFDGLATVASPPLTRLLKRFFAQLLLFAPSTPLVFYPLAGLFRLTAR